MSEYICPQTEEPCDFHGLCELKSRQLRGMAHFWAAKTRELHEGYLDSIGENQYTLAEGGARKLTPEEVERLKASQPSSDFAADEAEMDAYATIASMLPVPANPNDIERPHDSYEQLSGKICLYGTAKVVEDILDLDSDERELAVANLLLRISGLTS